MDNVSHSLAGWALSRAAGPVRPAGTTLALVLASNLPDLDVVLYARGDAAYLLWHRGVTHSVLGLAVLPPLLAAGLWLGYGRRTRYRWFLLLATAGVGLHLVYDLVTPWGTMLLFPFAVDRFSLDWLFIVDLVTWGAPIAALLVARRRPDRARAAVVAFLAALLAYGAVAGLLHREAVGAVVRAEAAAGRGGEEVEAVPRFAAPLRYAGFAVASPPAPEPRIARYDVTLPPAAARARGRIERGFAGPWVRRALATRDGQAYLWWARVPVARTSIGDDAVEVALFDLRYLGPVAPALETWAPFSLRFRFDRGTGALLDVRW